MDSRYIEGAAVFLRSAECKYLSQDGNRIITMIMIAALEYLAGGYVESMVELPRRASQPL